MKAPIYQHWSSPVLLQTATRPHPTKAILGANGVETPVMVAHHQWQFYCQELLPASEGGDGEKKCLHQRIEWNGSNGNLFKHCEAKHPDLHKTLSANSKHTSKQVPSLQAPRQLFRIGFAIRIATLVGDMTGLYIPGY